MFFFLLPILRFFFVEETTVQSRKCYFIQFTNLFEDTFRNNSFLNNCSLKFFLDKSWNFLFIVFEHHASAYIFFLNAPLFHENSHIVMFQGKERLYNVYIFELFAQLIDVMNGFKYISYFDFLTQKSFVIDCFLQKYSDSFIHSTFVNRFQLISYADFLFNLSINCHYLVVSISNKISHYVLNIADKFMWTFT